jgi:transposase-like protein
MKKRHKAEALRRRVEAERAASTGVWPRYSEELKRDVVALANEPGWSLARASKAAGLACSIVQRWSRKAHVQAGTPRLQRVKVVTAANVQTRTFALEFASGARVAGLTWSEVTSLVRGDR